jgi:hypothetical protein
MTDNEKPAAIGRDGLPKIVRLAAEHINDSPKTGQGQRRDGYPFEPGWRSTAVGETSRAAAIASRPVAKKQADLCLEIIGERGHATPEQITAALAEQGHRVLLTSIRARCTGLHKQGVLRDSGNRGLGESLRCKVISWEIVPRPEGANATSVAA